MFTLAAYTQHFDPVGNSLFASAIVAALPLITLFEIGRASCRERV